MAIPVFATWLAQLLAGYGVSSALDELSGVSDDVKFAGLYGQLYEIRQNLSALTGETSLNACLAPWDIREAIEDEETGLYAGVVHVTNKHQDTDALVQEAVDAVTNINWGNQNLWNLMIAMLGMEGEDPPPPPVIATSKDTERILAGLYYVNWLWYNNPPPIDDTDILAAITSAQNAINGHTDTELGTVETSINNNTDAEAVLVKDAIAALNNIPASIITDVVNAAVGTLTGEITEAGDLVLDALETLPELIAPPTVAPVWPGIAGVTLGTTVALTNGLHLTTAMDGVIIAITTPPTKTGTMVVGDATFDYREGQVAFESDEGDIEMWQYLGFRNALYTPRSMQHAAGARFRVLAGAEGTVTPWTVTP